MNTILISTSSLWNCGDDFIRQGLLDLLNLQPLIPTLWWNRAPGVTPTFANDLSANLRAANYILIAGTPEWLDRNEALYTHALQHDTPMALIGVGLRGCSRRASQRRLIEKVAQSSLVEVCLARDPVALEFLRASGFKDVELMPDPAFFMKPLDKEKKHNILCWRDIRRPRPSHLRQPLRWAHWVCRGKRMGTTVAIPYDKLMQSVFFAMAEPKIVVVHDNREIHVAERLFGSDHVFHATDFRELLKVYSGAISYVGSRIHGAIAAAIHGAHCHLIYANLKACVVESSVGLLSRHAPEISNGIKVSFLEREHLLAEDVGAEPLNGGAFSGAIQKERTRIRRRLMDAPALREYMRKEI